MFHSGSYNAAILSDSRSGRTRLWMSVAVHSAFGIATEVVTVLAVQLLRDMGVVT